MISSSDRNGGASTLRTTINFSDFFLEHGNIHLMAPAKNKVQKVGVLFEPKKVTAKTPR
jgi:hypothetical protein